MATRLIHHTPLGKVRFAGPTDAPAVMAMVNKCMSKNFRVYDLNDVQILIDHSIMAICQLSADNEVVGFMALKDYPLIPAVHSSGWESYIYTKYKMWEMNARNTLFVHLLSWNPTYGRKVVDSLLKTLFMHDPHLLYVAMLKTRVKYPLLMPGQARAEGSFRRVQAMERGVSGDRLPALCVAERKEISGRLRIRRAVEEDNDDIIPIVEHHSDRLRSIYGDYYVSEIVSRHPESDRVLIVCEHKELAVGVMSLNTQINYETLEESFDLAPFAGLRRVVVEQTAEPEPLGAGDGDVPARSPTGSFDTQKIESGYSLETVAGALARPTPSTEAKSEDGKDEPKEGTRATEPPGTGAPTPAPKKHYNADPVVLHLLEEEEMEFDIINIEAALLELPALLTPNDKYFETPVAGKPTVLLPDQLPKGNPKKRPSKQGITLVESDPVVRYTGPPNAFLLEIFAMHTDYDERYGFDMLEVAFEMFPDRDYCVLCLPSNHTCFPLLEHFTLVTPYSTKMRFINDTLYVAHVNSISGHLRVRPGEAKDIPHVTGVLDHAPRKDYLMELFEDSLTSTMLESYVLVSEYQPVGVCIIGPMLEGTSIRTQYELEPEPLQPGGDCMMLVGVTSPALEPHSRWFLREVIRQSRYVTVFWLCQPMAQGAVASPRRNMMSLVERMQPVRRRQLVPNITGNANINELFVNMATPYALWKLERSLTSKPLVYINNNIVVVGASSTGLAFLERLIMGQTSKYLSFTNLTLVSEDGLPIVMEPLKAAETCIIRGGKYTDNYIKSVPFNLYVDIIAGVMVNIDRKKKCIYLKGGGVKFYDELVITCGQQFQHPFYMKESLEIVKELRKGLPCDRMLMDNPAYQPDCVPSPPELPDNVMLISSLFHANGCFRKLLRMISEDKTGLHSGNPIVVYGACLEAYCCAAALLQVGVAPEAIAFVEPPHAPNALRVNCFNDETIDERVQASLQNLGVRTIRRSKMVEWRTHNGRVVELLLMSTLHCRAFPCFALFYYGMKAIDLNAFKAINESGLVYDGGLVVGPMFETNDKHIFGGGTCCTYSRRLYADGKTHGRYNSEDVGDAIAQIFIRKFNPFVMQHPEFGECPSALFPIGFDASLLSAVLSGGRSSTSGKPVPARSIRRWQPVMKFSSPMVRAATLPGPLHYLKVRAPGPELPMEVKLYLAKQGHALITDKSSKYFRLNLNVLHCVDGVTCLSPSPFPIEILAQLYGKHEAFFNRLLARYQLNQIESFYDFFLQPWMSAIYQDNFTQLLADINDQGIGKVYDFAKALYQTPALEDKPTNGTTCSDYPCPEENETNLPTIKEMVDKSTGKSGPGFAKLPIAVGGRKFDNIPSECGQSPDVRAEVAAFWEDIGGEEAVIGHISKYLLSNSVTNPHYAQPQANTYRPDIGD